MQTQSKFFFYRVKLRTGEVGQQMRRHADIAQARDGTQCVIGMKGGIDLVAGQRGAHSHHRNVRATKIIRAASGQAAAAAMKWVTISRLFTPIEMHPLPLAGIQPSE